MPEPLGFWEPGPTDLELTPDIVRDVLREQFPELPATSVEAMGEGWENQTFLIDHHVVFQFPRQLDGGGGFEWEDGVHTLVASFIGDRPAIPRFSRWGRPSPRFGCRFVGYEVVPGVAANDPSVRLNPALADDIGSVLSRLHAIPAEAAATVGVGAADPEKADLVGGLKRVRHWVDTIPEMRTNLPELCAWLDSVRQPPDPYAGPPRFIHDDFQMEHVLVDRTMGRLSGIIDWGPGLGDPVRDFVYVFLHGGWSFFQRALDVYDLPLDAEFVDRTLFSARLGALYWLAYTLTHAGSIQEVVATARRVLELE
jgi:aminoglycoside phosphotransferase (APT) family kinase protein